MWVKTDAFGWEREPFCFCCVVNVLFGPSASLFTALFPNRWRPVSWWSWEEVAEGSCWAEEEEGPANRQTSHHEFNNSFI